MARVMVVGGGKWQMPIVKMAKNQGHYVICSNLYEDSPAFKYADKSVVADVLDKERNLRIAKENQIDAVLTSQSDIAVPTVAYVAEKMNLRGISSEVANRFTNKHLMRKITSEAGFPSPKARLCHEVSEATDFIKNVKKSIMKPLDSQSSRGVFVVNNKQDVIDNWEECITYSNCEKAVVIEEYIDGVEFTVDGLKTEDNYYITAISEKSHFKNNPSVADRLLFSHSNERFDYMKLRLINSEMVAAMELPFGITHAEYKYYNGEFYLIEIAARGGGTRISSDIVPILSGVNSESVYLNLLLGRRPNVKMIEDEKYAVLGFFDFGKGIVKVINGVEQATKIKGVHAMDIEVDVGQVLRGINDDRSRPGYYIVYADSLDELLQREKQLKETIEVIVE